MDSTIQKIKTSINEFISLELSKQRVPNRQNLDDVVDKIVRDIDIDEEVLEGICDKIYTDLENRNVIYKVGNNQTYRDVVKTKV